MPSRRQYVAVETAISMAINGALSIGFVFLVFHGKPVVQAGGAHGIAVDMAPQTFMILLMSCLVPALVTRRRHRAGALPWHVRASTAERPTILLRAATLAIAVTAVVLAVSWLALPRLFAAGVAFHTLLLAKTLYGMALAACATPWAIANVLR